jgi:hypothetical protein
MKTSGGSQGAARSPRTASVNLSAALPTGAQQGDGGVPGLDQSVDSAVQLLSALPSSDHALAYVVLSSGVGPPSNAAIPSFAESGYSSLRSLQLILVALATHDSELFVTFPGMVSGACYVLRCCALFIL